MTPTIVSLGGGCDVATELLGPRGLSQSSHFFDFLWNLDGGLSNVTRILGERLAGFDRLENFIFQKHPEWNTPEVPGQLRLACADLDAPQLVHHRYPDIALIHYEHNAELPLKFARKAERLLRLLDSGGPVTFVYYRQYHAPIAGRYQNGPDYDIDEKLEHFHNETQDFVHSVSLEYPGLGYRLVSCFMEPAEALAGVTDKVDRFFQHLKDRDEVCYRRVLRRRSEKSLKSWGDLIPLFSWEAPRTGPGSARG